jgi:hypothetical protein
MRKLPASTCLAIPYHLGAQPLADSQKKRHVHLQPQLFLFMLSQSSVSVNVTLSLWKASISFEQSAMSTLEGVQPFQKSEEIHFERFVDISLITLLQSSHERSGMPSETGGVQVQPWPAQPLL